jgi:hypothetical protein
MKNRHEFDEQHAAARVSDVIIFPVHCMFAGSGKHLIVFLKLGNRTFTPGEST